MSPIMLATKPIAGVSTEPTLSARLCRNDGFTAAHLVGIAGSGMKALAELLHGLGWTVTGSELQASSAVVRGLRQRGMRVHSGHANEFLSPDADVLVYSSAVGASNPERRMADRLGIPQFSFSQMLGRLMQEKVGISVAGTHGKSTTAALIAWVLRAAGMSPSAVIGAGLCGDDVNGWAGEGELFVAESCEFQRNFLNLHPKHGVILGIEPDHFDCFSDLDDATSAFAEFAARIDPRGSLLLNADCSRCAEIIAHTTAEPKTFSLQPGADWWAADLRPVRDGTRFRVFNDQRYVTEISLPIPGRHNVVNALAAIAMCSRLGVAVGDLRAAICEFPGIRRRYERVGSWRGVTMIDDYAHHPTAVRATLQTVRAEFPQRRVWCVFQPHQILRTKRLMDEFAASFDHANAVLIAPVYAARETGTDETALVSAELATKIAANGRPARFVPSLDRIMATLEDESRPGDVLVTMGAGDIDRIGHEFSRRVQRNHTPQ